MQRTRILALWADLQQWIWQGKPDRFGLRWLQRLCRVVLYVTRDVVKGDLQLNAMSLSYTTLLSLVPLLAVSFSVLKAFGSDRVIEPFLHAILEPLGNSAPELTARILEFVSNIKVGVLGAVGIAMLFYIVIALMQKIERVFNGIWRVHQLRDLSTRLFMYLSVLMVGPVFVLAAMGLTATLLSNSLTHELLHITPIRGVFSVVTWFVPVLMWIGVFTFIYTFIPNTRVRPTAALAGGVVAAITWNGIGLAFGSLIASSTQYTAIYSAFASLVLFMVWLQVAWMIVLLGASVSHAWQNADHLSARRISRLGQADRLAVAALESLSVIVHRFVQGREPPSNDDIKLELLNRLSLDPEITDLALNRLATASLIRSVQEDGACWLPARPANQLSLASVRIALFGHPDGWHPAYQPITRAWLRLENTYIEERLASTSFDVNMDNADAASSTRTHPDSEADAPIGASGKTGITLSD